MVPIEVPIHKYFSEPPNYNPAIVYWGYWARVAKIRFLQ